MAGGLHILIIKCAYTYYELSYLHINEYYIIILDHTQGCLWSDRAGRHDVIYPYISFAYVSFADAQCTRSRWPAGGGAAACDARGVAGSIPACCAQRPLRTHHDVVQKLAGRHGIGHAISVVRAASRVRSPPAAAPPMIAVRPPGGSEPGPNRRRLGDESAGQPEGLYARFAEHFVQNLAPAPQQQQQQQKHFA